MFALGEQQPILAALFCTANSYSNPSIFHFIQWLSSLSVFSVVWGAHIVSVTHLKCPWWLLQLLWQLLPLQPCPSSGCPCGSKRQPIRTLPDTCWQLRCLGSGFCGWKWDVCFQLPDALLRVKYVFWCICSYNSWFFFFHFCRISNAFFLMVGVL